MKRRRVLLFLAGLICALVAFTLLRPILPAQPITRTFPAAGIKKVSDKSNKSSAKAKSSTEKVKVRERDKKNVGKRRQPKLADDSVAQVDGFAPLKKKPKTGLLDESEG